MIRFSLGAVLQCAGLARDVRSPLPARELRYRVTQRAFRPTKKAFSMTQTDIFVLSRIPNLAEQLRTTLKDRANVVEIVAKFTVQDKEPQLKPEVVERLATAEVLVTDSHILKDVIYKLPKMKWIQLTSAGVDRLLPHIDPTQPSPSYQVTRASCFGILMAEYVIAGIINFERGLYKYFEFQQRKEWNDTVSVKFRTLSDLNVGILGAGVIGNEIATTLKQFGTNVYGFARRRRTITEVSVTPFSRIYNTLPDLLKECDYIVNILPSTPQTLGMLNGDVLQQCHQKKPVFINMGRGTIINEESIINALKNRWISGAILDVHNIEPLPARSALWTTPNPSPSYQVTRASCFGILMAEYVIAGIINFERGLYKYFEFQQRKE